jgi:hypothetical protein
MQSRIWMSTVVLALLSLSACGGGGGGDGSSPMPGAASFDLAAGLANLSASTITANLTIKGTVNGFEISQSSGQFSQSAAVALTRCLDWTLTTIVFPNMSLQSRPLHFRLRLWRAIRASLE